MITLEKVDGATLEAEAEKAGITLPLEQTKVWSGFQADIDGRTPWGNYLIKRDGELVAVISFIDFETHGYHYLRSMHGPAWVAKPKMCIRDRSSSVTLAPLQRGANFLSLCLSLIHL